MGTTSLKESNRAVKGDSTKIFLNLRNRDIILDWPNKIKLSISDIDTFPDKLVSLKLWDSQIVLARFAIFNKLVFAGRTILEMNAGVGLASITIKKYCKSKSVAACETRKEAVENMSRNAQKNGVKKSEIISFLINWEEYSRYTNQYDVLIASDLLDTNLPHQLLCQVIGKFLKDDGIMLCVMPENRNAMEALMGVIKQQNYNYIMETEVLTDEKYYTSPLFNKLEGEEEFKRLTQHNKFVALKIRKNRTGWGTNVPSEKEPFGQAKQEEQTKPKEVNIRHKEQKLKLIEPSVMTQPEKPKLKRKQIQEKNLPVTVPEKTSTEMKSQPINLEKNEQLQHNAEIKVTEKVLPPSLKVVPGTENIETHPEKEKTQIREVNQIIHEVTQQIKEDQDVTQVRPQVYNMPQTEQVNQKIKEDAKEVKEEVTREVSHEVSHIDVPEMVEVKSPAMTKVEAEVVTEQRNDAGQLSGDVVVIPLEEGQASKEQVQIQKVETQVTVPERLEISIPAQIRQHEKKVTEVKAATAQSAEITQSKQEQKEEQKEQKLEQKEQKEEQKEQKEEQKEEQKGEEQKCQQAIQESKLEKVEASQVIATAQNEESTLQVAAGILSDIIQQIEVPLQSKNEQASELAHLNAESMEPIAESMEPIAESMEPIAESMEPIAESMEQTAETAQSIEQTAEFIESATQPQEQMQVREQAEGEPRKKKKNKRR